MTDDRQTLEASVTDPLIDFVNRVYAQEMEEPGAFKPFRLVEDDHRVEYNAVERALAVVMSNYRSILLDVRDDHDLLDQPDVDAESASQVQALRVPDDWEPRDVRVAEIEMDE